MMTRANHDEDGDQTKQAIVFGFDVDSDADVIKATINDFLNEGTRRAKVVKVDTFTDPAAVGFVEFSTVAAKVGFFKKIKNHNTKLPNGNRLVFDNNETFEVRKLNKRLGQIKFHINAKTDNGLNDIEINRKSGIVKVKGKIVAQTGGDGNTQYMDDSIAGLIRHDVDEYMTSWLAKTGRE